VTDLSLYSSLFLTVMIAIGLFFFIRASIKDRTEQAILVSDVAPATLQTRCDTYLQGRAYQQVEPGMYRGVVAPSFFLAIFLSVLALAGLGRVALLGVVLLPTGGSFWFLGMLLSPLAGFFYWRGALRPEIIQLKLVPTAQSTEIHIRGHRDELAKFKEALGFED